MGQAQCARERPGGGIRGSENLGDPAQHARGLVAFGIGLRSVHEALGVVRIVESPVVDSPACDSAAEVLREAQHEHRGGGAAEGEALDSDAGAVDVWQRLQPPRPGDVVPELDHGHLPERLVHALAAVLARRARVAHDVDHPVAEAPVVGGVAVAPHVAHVGGAGAAVELHDHRVLAGGVEVLRKRHQRIEVEAVVLYPHYLGDGKAVRRPGGVGDLLTVEPVAAAAYAHGRSAGVGHPGGETASVFRELHSGDRELRVGERRDPPLAVEQVEGGVQSGVALGGEPHAAFGIRAQQPYVPVLPVR